MNSNVLDLNGVWVTQKYAFVKTHGIVCLRLVCFITCNFHLKNKRKRKRKKQKEKEDKREEGKKERRVRGKE